MSNEEKSPNSAGGNAGKAEPIHADKLLEDSDPPALSDVLLSHEHENQNEGSGPKGGGSGSQQSPGRPAQ